MPNSKELKIGLIVTVVAVVTLVAGIFLGTFFGGGGSGGALHVIQERFNQGLIAGTTDQLTIGNDGSITTSGTVTLSGETRAPLVELGSLVTPTTGSTTTLTAAQVCNSNVIEWEPTVANSSTTLPTSATLISDCLTADGDSIQFLFRNISATAASTTVVVAGTGSVLLEPDGQNVVIAGGTSAALITIYRLTSTTTAVVVDEVVDAD